MLVKVDLDEIEQEVRSWVKADILLPVVRQARLAIELRDALRKVMLLRSDEATKEASALLERIGGW